MTVVDEELGGELAADGDEIVDGDLGTAQELGPGLSGDEFCRLRLRRKLAASGDAGTASQLPHSANAG